MRRVHNLSKRQFSNLFIVLTLVLLTLPFFLTSQDLITKLLNYTGLSYVIQRYVIPVEIKFVAVILSIFRIQFVADDKVIVLYRGGIEAYRAQIIWSCIGWQSVVLFFVTLVTGFKGRYTPGSKIETMIIGLMGTFWVNIGRIVIIYLLGYFLGQLPAIIFHNYIGTFVIVGWLFLYWWFSYSYVLAEKNEYSNKR